MTRVLSHEEASVALEPLSLDALGDEERREVLAHAMTCDRCGPALAALRETAASLALLAPRVPLDAVRSAGMRARLLDRAATDAAVRPGGTPPTSWTVPTPVRPLGARRWSGVQLFALAAGLAFVVSAVVLARTWRERDRLRAAVQTTMVNQVALTSRLDSLRAALAAEQRILDAVTGPRVRVVNLAAGGARPPVGRMFWDQATNRWTLFAHYLPVPPTGRTYQLWLVSKGVKISAGTFQPDSAGQALVRAEYPLPADALDAIAVTEEPAGGVRQPTGPIVLAGSGAR